MNNGTLKEILKVKFLSFTKEEIESIMDEELEKDPEEMDAELIDMCLDILTGEPKEKADEKITDSSAVSGKKVKVINIKKGFFVAAIITLLIVIAIPVGAKIFEIDVPESMLKIYEEYFKLNIDGENRSEDLDTLLAENDLKDVILPKFLFSDCEITDFETYDEESVIKVRFDYDSREERIKGRVTLNNSDEYSDFFDGKTLINDQYESGKRIVVNGIEVVILNEENKSIMIYRVDEAEYNIVLYGATFEKVIEIASDL